jgi:hypothetical protein
VISQNTFVVNDHLTPGESPGDFLFNFPQGGVSLNPHGGTFEAIVSHNTFDEVMHAAGGLGSLTLGHNTGNGNSEFIVRNNTFDKAWDAAMELRAEGNNTMAVLIQNNTWISGNVDNGTGDVGFATLAPFQGIFANVRQGGGTTGGRMDLTIRNDALTVHDNANSPRPETLTLETQADNAGNTLNLALGGGSGIPVTAPYRYKFTQSNGTSNLYRGLSASSVPATILSDNFVTGGGGNPALDPPTVVTSGTITATNTAPTLPSITIP